MLLVQRLRAAAQLQPVYSWRTSPRKPVSKHALCLGHARPVFCSFRTDLSRGSRRCREKGDCYVLFRSESSPSSCTAASKNFARTTFAKTVPSCSLERQGCITSSRFCLRSATSRVCRPDLEPTISGAVTFLRLHRGFARLQRRAAQV